MHIALHLAITHANNAVGQLLHADFAHKHHTGEKNTIATAREYLAKASAELNRYEAILDHGETSAKLAVVS